MPKSWCTVPLGYVCILNEGEPIADKEYPYIDVKGLRTGNYTSRQFGKYIPAGTTLILVDGENSGEVFRTPVNGYQGSTFKQLLINDNLNEEYIIKAIKLHRKVLRESKVGSAIPHLNKKLFKSIEVPIPPYKEQQRIINAITKAFMSLDLIIESL